MRRQIHNLELIAGNTGHVEMFYSGSSILSSLLKDWMPAVHCTLDARDMFAYFRFRRFEAFAIFARLRFLFSWRACANLAS